MGTEDELLSEGYALNALSGLVVWGRGSTPCSDQMATKTTLDCVYVGADFRSVPRLFFSLFLGHAWSWVCSVVDVNPVRLEPAMPGQNTWHKMLCHLQFKGLLSAGSNCHFVVMQITEEEERPISYSSCAFNVYQKAPRFIFNEGNL